MPIDQEQKVEIQLEDHDDKGPVATITFKGRTHLNLIGPSLIQEMTDAVQDTQNNENLRLIILTGYGDAAFIGGVDIKEMVNLDEATAKIFITGLHRFCQSIRGAAVPVIAKIQGYCLGGGLEVAAACDLRIATDSSKFGMPEVKVGIPSVIEAALLPALIGWGKTKELLLLGHMIDTDEALSCGLVNRVTSPDQLNESINEWVNHICKAGPNAIRLQKSLYNRWDQLPLEQAIEEGIEYFSRAYQTDEPRMMMQNFIDRKK